MPPAEPSILFLTRELAIGGAQRQLVELASGLRRAGWKVTVATFYPGGELESDLVNADVRLISLRKRGRWDIVSFGWRLWRALRDESPHIVHGYLDVANVLLVLLKPFLPSVKVVWGVRSSNMDNTQYDATWEVTFRVSAWLSHFADLIICNSEAGRQHHLRHGYARDRTLVIPNGIDLDRFKPDPAARERVRREFGIASTEWLVGCVARLDPMKDHPTFLRAAARVAAVEPRARFVCVGGGPADYHGELIRLAEELGVGEKLIWSGARSDIESVYNALDVSVSASAFGEGFSNAIAESMAVGVACAATNVGDAERLLNGSGRVCPPGDPVALADAILALLHSASSERSAALKDLIRQHYSSSALCKRTAAELSQLLRQCTPQGSTPTGTTP